MLIQDGFCLLGIQNNDFYFRKTNTLIEYLKNRGEVIL